MFNVSVNDKKNIYRSKPVMNVDTVPKPLTYDYMPEGYPSKSVETVTLMEEQELAFSEEHGLMGAKSPVVLDIKLGDKLTIVWDGVSYDAIVKKVTFGPNELNAFGNPSLLNSEEATDYPFFYGQYSDIGAWYAADTATTHTIKVMRPTVKYTPIDANFMPEGYPKKDGWAVEWDGNIDGKVSAVGAPIYKFSDRVLTYEEFLSAKYVIYGGGEQYSGMVSEAEPKQTQLADAVSNFRCLNSSVQVVVVSEDNVEAGGMTFPEKGLYVREGAKPFKLIKETITPMSIDFIPKNLNVVFSRGSGSSIPTSCNVAYDELRGWIENGIPVFATYKNEDDKGSVGVLMNIVQFVLNADSLMVYYQNRGSTDFFKYNPDGTFSGSGGEES